MVRNRNQNKGKLRRIGQAMTADKTNEAFFDKVGTQTRNPIPLQLV
jgi:hypothetical protein